MDVYARAGEDGNEFLLLHLSILLNVIRNLLFQLSFFHHSQPATQKGNVIVYFKSEHFSLEKNYSRVIFNFVALLPRRRLFLSDRSN